MLALIIIYIRCKQVVKEKELSIKDLGGAKAEFNRVKAYPYTVGCPGIDGLVE